MTKMVFSWQDRYELESVTRDCGLSFSDNINSYSLVVRRQESDDLIRLDLFKDKYCGLNRCLAQIELQMSEDEFIQRMKDSHDSLEILLSDPVDYFETKRSIQFKWVQGENPERMALETSFVS